MQRDSAELESLIERRSRQPPAHAARDMCTMFAIVAVASLLVFAIWAINADTRTEGGSDQAHIGESGLGTQSRLGKAYYLMGKWIGMKEDMAGLDVRVNGIQDELDHIHKDLTRNAQQVKFSFCFIYQFFFFCIEEILPKLPFFFVSSPFLFLEQLKNVQAQQDKMDTQFQTLRTDITDYVKDEMEKAFLALQDQSHRPVVEPIATTATSELTDATTASTAATASLSSSIVALTPLKGSTESVVDASTSAPATRAVGNSQMTPELVSGAQATSA
jgi:hypothetical protein